MLDIQNLFAGYRTKSVLKDINVCAKPGEFIALVGPNGSGKSTLLKSLCGLITPTSGDIKLNNKNLTDLVPRQRARHVAYLPQIREAMPKMLVADIIALGRAPYRGTLGKISDAGCAAINTAAERAQITPFLDREIGRLSGGEQARVLLARMLAVDAPLLLADEPIAALDPFYQISMMETLKAETENTKTVITALHDLSLAHKFADQIWVMQGGNLIANAAPDDALTAGILRSVFKITLPRNGFQSPERLQN